MHADRYQSKAPRSLGAGGALLINGVIITGMIFAAPNILVVEHPEKFITTDIPLDMTEPPPIDEPPVAKVQPRTMPVPTAPKPEIAPTTENTSTATDVIPDVPVVTKTVLDPGPPIAIDPPKPVAVLVGATQDPRYARDFQPDYPTQELRAQRDGLVKIRVLIGIDGRVKAVEPVSATSDAFFAVTQRQALGKWRFKPATRGGVPEESWKTMAVRFRLADMR
ncbi:energy transducer TonB [Sphingomonas sp. RS6]